MQRSGTEAIRTQIQLSKPKREITKITNIKKGVLFQLPNEASNVSIFTLVVTNLAARFCTLSNSSWMPNIRYRDLRLMGLSFHIPGLVGAPVFYASFASWEFKQELKKTTTVIEPRWVHLKTMLKPQPTT